MYRPLEVTFLEWPRRRAQSSSWWQNWYSWFRITIPRPPETLIVDQLGTPAKIRNLYEAGIVVDVLIKSVGCQYIEMVLRGTTKNLATRENLFGLNRALLCPLLNLGLPQVPQPQIASYHF
jgi:hypothetical protein